MVVVVCLVQGVEVFGHDVVKLLEEDLALSRGFTSVVEEELLFFLGTHPLYIHICICMYVYTYVCLSVCMYVYTYTPTHIHTHVHGSRK